MPEFQGKLHVFVDVAEPHSATPSSPADADDVFSRRAPGDLLWYRIGDAIGNNARGSYCARTSTSKLRCFGTFVEASDFVRRKRQNRPDRVFHLVYDLQGQKSIVTSLEQILRRDGGTAAAATPAARADEALLATLTRKAGKIVAVNALTLLRTLERDGEPAARALFSPATYDRLWKVLRDVELVEHDLSPAE